MSSYDGRTRRISAFTGARSRVAIREKTKKDNLSDSARRVYPVCPPSELESEHSTAEWTVRAVRSLGVLELAERTPPGSERFHSPAQTTGTCRACSRPRWELIIARSRTRVPSLSGPFSFPEQSRRLPPLNLAMDCSETSRPSQAPRVAATKSQLRFTGSLSGADAAILSSSAEKWVVIMVRLLSPTKPHSRVQSDMKACCTFPALHVMRVP